ncbi:MAG: MATE family efflux transporter [Methylobacterium mesophilicum]|nr:MATE family efflux transporter [Methylobacterium mesophilicum]
MSAITAGTFPAASHSWRGEIQATLKLAWPMILTNLAQTAMTATDVVMVGRLGPDSLAAAALGSNLYYLPLVAGMGLMLATQPMIATELGRKSSSVRDPRRTVRQGLWLAVLVVLPIWAFLWQAESVLNAMGQNRDLAAMAGQYMSTLQWGILPFFGFVVLRSFVSALERPGWALAVMVVAVVFNALANWALVFGHWGFPALGLEGSGAATALANTIMFIGLALVVSTHRKFRRYHLFGRFWRADWPRFRMLVVLGLPIGGLLAFEVGLFNGAALVMGLIDTPSLAAHAITIQIASATFMVPLGLGQAATVRVGLAYGAADRDGVRRAGWTALGLGVGFMSLAALTMLLIPQHLIGIFLDGANPANAAVIPIAVSFLAFAALFQIVDGAQAVGAGMLRGLHDTKLPMVYAGFGYWAIGMPLGLFLAFPLGMRGQGIWLGLCVGLAVVAVLLVSRWLRRDRFAHGAPVVGAGRPSVMAIH